MPSHPASWSYFSQDTLDPSPSGSRFPSVRVRSPPLTRGPSVSPRVSNPIVRVGGDEPRTWIGRWARVMDTSSNLARKKNAAPPPTKRLVIKAFKGGCEHVRNVETRGKEGSHGRCRTNQVQVAHEKHPHTSMHVPRGARGRRKEKTEGTLRSETQEGATDRSEEGKEGSRTHEKGTRNTKKSGDEAHVQSQLHTNEHVGMVMRSCLWR